MQHNYQQNLTQDFISSLFFLNRNYLSTLFKLKTYLFRTPLVENDILSFKLNVILLITKCEILNFFYYIITGIDTLCFQQFGNVHKELTVYE